MGRSRDGLTAKIYALVDANGMSITIKLTEGQAHDGSSAADMINGLQAGPILLAGRAYHSNGPRELRTLKATVHMRLKASRITKPVFSAFLHRYRNLVERFSNRLKHYRAIPTRYEKRPTNYLAFVKLGAIRIGLRYNEVVSLIAPISWI